MENKKPIRKKLNRHQYINLSPYCRCGNNKFKIIKISKKLECSRCKQCRKIE